MLYLRTGANGSCKTLFTLKDLREKQIKELRPVCLVVGDDQDPTRRYVKVKPEKMAEFGWTTCQFKDWQAQSDGTIFLADECHNYLPKRPNASAVPEPVSKLAEHRARGMDFFLLTQHPGNIDTFVTRLIGAPGWHQHLKRIAGGSSLTNVVQWDAVNNQCEKNGSGKSGQITMRGQPKDVYDWYESAELHTAKLKIPKQMLYLVVALVLIPVLFYFAGRIIWENTQRHNPVAGGGVSVAAAAASAPLAYVSRANSNGQEKRPSTPAEYVRAYEPRVAAFMHSAPVYDELTKPRRVPVPAACMVMAKHDCKCFTQDATPYPVSAQICGDLVRHGIFLSFDPEGERRAHREQPRQVAAADPVAKDEAVMRDKAPAVTPGLLSVVRDAVAPVPPLPSPLVGARRAPLPSPSASGRS